MASCYEQMTILVFINCLNAAYHPMYRSCGVQHPLLGAAGWPEHPWVLPERELWGWPGDLGCGRSRGAGGKPAHVAQPLPSQCSAAAEHKQEHEHAPSVSSAGRGNQPRSCAASPRPLCSLRQLTKAICYINAEPRHASRHLLHPCPKRQRLGAAGLRFAERSPSC